MVSVWLSQHEKNIPLDSPSYGSIRINWLIKDSIEDSTYLLYIEVLSMSNNNENHSPTDSRKEQKCITFLVTFLSFIERQWMTMSADV